jgi:hypothetical protein
MDDNGDSVTLHHCTSRHNPARQQVSLSSLQLGPGRHWQWHPGACPRTRRMPQLPSRAEAAVSVFALLATARRRYHSRLSARASAITWSISDVDDGDDFSTEVLEHKLGCTSCGDDDLGSVKLFLILIGLGERDSPGSVGQSGASND